LAPLGIFFDVPEKTQHCRLISTFHPSSLFRVIKSKVPLWANDSNSQRLTAEILVPRRFNNQQQGHTSSTRKIKMSLPATPVESVVSPAVDTTARAVEPASAAFVPGQVRMYVNGLARRCRIEDVKKHFADYENDLGNIWVARDPPGFSFFILRGDMAKAAAFVERYNGTTMDGRAIAVEIAKQQQTPARRRERSPDLPRRGNHGGGDRPHHAHADRVVDRRRRDDSRERDVRRRRDDSRERVDRRRRDDSRDRSDRRRRDDSREREHRRRDDSRGRSDRRRRDDSREREDRRRRDDSRERSDRRRREDSRGRERDANPAPKEARRRSPSGGRSRSPSN
jgi:hypothetical protein